jgi:hypothetical protein
MGFHFEVLNLQENNSVNDKMNAILHYIPSAYSTEQSSQRLIRLLQEIYFEKLVVIFHGVYREEEKRYYKDTPCPFQKEHLNFIFKKSTEIIALSKTVEVNLKSWLSKFNINRNIITLDHPGLFISQPSVKTNFPYVFIGGVSRPKKNCNNESTDKLIKICKERKLPVWMHWTNMSDFDYYENNLHNVWKTTKGLVSDQSWCNIITNAKVILCPYETHIQSVSGLIAEALSAKCYVLTTAFDFANEMKKRFPSLVIVNDNIEQWPDLIEKLLHENIHILSNYYSWKDFTDDLLSALVYSTEGNMVYNY